MDRQDRDRLEALQAEKATLRGRLGELESQLVTAAAEHAAVRRQAGSLGQELEALRDSTRQLERKLRGIKVRRWLGNLAAGIGGAVFVTLFVGAVWKDGGWFALAAPLGLYAVLGGIALLQKLYERWVSPAARSLLQSDSGPKPQPEFPNAAAMPRGTPGRYQAALEEYVKTHRPGGQ